MSLEAADEEAETSPERLELLAIIRALEALDQPSRVTLVSASRSVQRGLKFGLSQWRENDWLWERYGRMTPVKHEDLWRRLDRLLDIHAVDCRPGRTKGADDLNAPIPQRGRRLRVDPPARITKNLRTKEPKNRRNTRGPRRRFGSLILRFLDFFRLRSKGRQAC
jgi:hypothetical protein